MADGEWYYVQGGQRQGPVSRGRLQQAVTSRSVATSDLVWTDGMAEWLPASRVPGLVPPGMVVPPPVNPGYYAPPAAAAPPDAGMRMLLPVGRSGWAIAAGYLGLFSFVIFPAPLALIISVVAILDIKKHPDRHGMGRAVFGLIMGVLGSILLVFILVAMASSPPHARHRY